MSSQLPEPFPEPQIERVSLRKMWVNILSILNLERGMFYTIWQLILAPGTAMQRYLFLDRSRFIEPLKFLVIAVAFFLFMAINYFPNSNWFDVDQEASFSNGSESYSKVTVFLQQYANLVMLFSVPIAAWISWRLFRKYRLNYGEHLVLNAFLYGFLTFVSILMLPLSLGSASTYSNSILAVFCIYSIYFFQSLFSMPWGKAIGYGLLFNVLNLLGSVIFLALVMVVLMVFF
ncbi:MAG TPA: DUF3667 domain-containing protein [Saprospiraceae bacterium]|nr:DUF3667 domain-containing protein [Saprospiraceae bacterium]HMQ82200.1 DUF3667 domain-containing protein [Saprospiraceae bacterium]